MFRQNLLISLFMLAATSAVSTGVCADSARSGVSIGSLTEVVNRDGIGDQLIGYGVVSGLQGTGDDFSKSPSLARSYLTLLENLEIPGLNELALSNQQSFAIVLVTANVPFTAGLGDQIDVSISLLQAGPTNHRRHQYLNCRRTSVHCRWLTTLQRQNGKRLRSADTRRSAAV